jgi:hypothetical protein|tara:strand:+ start:473 stop:1075 length:603 start_codon:yes stop_codon:yes gene_type:complete
MSGIIAQNSGRHTGLVKASSAGGTWNLILTQTASSSATIDFTSNIDSTYDEFVFKFINIHPETDGETFQFNMSIDSGSNYNVAKTSTSILVYNMEDDSAAGLQYDTNRDLAQGTGFQDITENQDNDNDSSASGTLHLFNPSSTTFVKHFISDSTMVRDGAKSYATKNAGYGNTTSAVDAIRFQMSSGNIDAGQISLYGIS